MPTEVKKLLAGQKAAHPDGQATEELVEIIERLVNRVNELDGVLEAIAAVSSPSGGATQDTEARAAIDAIIAAAT